MTTYRCPDGHDSSDADYCDTCGAPISGGGGDPGAAASGASPGATLGAPSGAPAGGGSMLDLGAGVPGAAGRDCPNCSAPNDAAALFCESCGYDFTTGAMPPALTPLTPPDGPAPSAPAPSAPAPSAPPAPAPPAPAPSAGDPGVASGAEWVAELWIDPQWYESQGATDPCPSPGPPIVVPLTERSLLIGRQSASRSIHPQIDCSTDSGVSRRHAQLTTDGQRWWVEDLQSANGTFVGTAGGSLPTTSIAPGLRREVAEDERLYVGAWTRIVIRKALPGE